MSTPPVQRPQLRITRVSSQLWLLLVWGLLLGLSFPRLNLWLLAHVALVPLTLVAVRGHRTRRVLVLSFLAGSAWWAVMVSWLIPVTFGGYVVLSFYLGLYVAAFVGAVRVLAGRGRVPLVLVVPLVQVACEYVRGLLVTGFPWFLLGHSQPRTMIQVADVFGAYGVSFAVAATSGLICDLLLQPLRRPTPEGGRWGMPVRLSLPLWAVLIAGSIGYGVYRLAEFEAGRSPSISPQPATIRVAVIQSNVPQSNKDNPAPGEDEKNFQKMLGWSAEAAKQRPDLILWPETMVPRALNEEAVSIYRRVPRGAAVYRDRLEAFARETGVPLIVGAPAMAGIETLGDGRRRFARRYNSAYLVDGSSTRLPRYDKLHRVPFGEYIPWVENSPRLKKWALSFTPYDYDYTLTRGEAIVRFSVDAGAESWRVAAPICFEDVVSYMPRRMVFGAGADKLADLLVNLTNDGWFAGRAEGPQHEQIARFRCVENRVPMARAVNTGISSFIDSTGLVVGRVSDAEGRLQSVGGWAIAELTRDGRRTLFARTGDLLAAVCLCLVVLWLAVQAVAGRRREADR